MKVSIVIPNWNGAEKLRKNLPAVLAVKGVDEIIVADDGSTDKSIEILENESQFAVAHVGQFIAAQGGDVLAVQKITAGCWPIKATQNIH